MVKGGWAAAISLNSRLLTFHKERVKPKCEHCLLKKVINRFTPVSIQMGKGHQSAFLIARWLTSSASLHIILTMPTFPNRSPMPVNSRIDWSSSKDYTKIGHEAYFANDTARLRRVFVPSFGYL